MCACVPALPLLVSLTLVCQRHTTQIRLIVWRTEDVLSADNFTGKIMNDLFVKAWLDGARDAEGGDGGVMESVWGWMKDLTAGEDSKERKVYQRSLQPLHPQTTLEPPT